MGRKIKFTQQQIISAITDTGGIKSEICKRCGCTLPTLNSYLERFPQVRAAYEEEEEKVLDMAEGALFSLIQNGDLGAICYFLNNKGKKRGYAHPRDTQQNDDKEKSDTRVGVLIAPGLLDDKAWEEAASVEQQADGEVHGAGQGQAKD